MLQCISKCVCSIGRFILNLITTIASPCSVMEVIDLTLDSNDEVVSSKYDLIPLCL